MFTRILAALSLIALAPLSARAQAPIAGPDYRIGPGDLLRLEVYEEPALDGERRVSPQGLLGLPLVGDLQVAGLTVEEAAARLRTHLEASYLQRATVTLLVVEFFSKPVTVIGAVERPGTVYMPRDWTLFEVLTAAGGVRESHGATAFILRRASNGLSDQLEIPLDDLLIRGDPAVNVPVFAHDVINVPASTDITVYFLGEVSQPGAVALSSRSPVTLLTAIAQAGGLTDRASNRILVKRKTADGGTVELEAHYQRLLSGASPDIELQEGDLILVKESFF